MIVFHNVSSLYGISRNHHSMLTNLQQVRNVVIPSLLLFQYILNNWSRQCFCDIQCHVRMSYSIKPLDVALCIRPWIRSWHTPCIRWHQMIAEIIEYGIKIFVENCRRSKHRGQYWINLNKPKLVHDPLKNTWINQA